MKWHSLFSFLFLVMPLVATVQADSEVVASSKKTNFLTREEQVFYESEKLWISELFDTPVTQQNFLVPYKVISNMPHNMSELKNASGNWLGYRDELDARGIAFLTTYTADIAGNPVGGKIPGGFTYCDNFAFGCLIQTEKLFGWHGGYLIFSGLQRDGYSLSKKNIQNDFTVQQVAGGHTFKCYEVSYQQNFLKDHASLKTGRIAALDDFDVSPLYWLYMNNAIDGNIQALPVNGNMTVYPNSSWGSRLKISLTKNTMLRLGAYQQAEPSVNGLNWNFYPSNGVMMMGQYSWEPEFCKPTSSSQISLTDQPIKKSPSGNKHLPSDEAFKTYADISQLKGLTGHYFMGGYYSTWEYNQFNSSSSAPNAYGLYWHADQMIYRPNPITDVGLVLWSAYSFCPQQNISKRPFQANAGAIYTGLIPGRVNDNIIFGGAYGNFSTSFTEEQQALGNGDRTYELMFELGYRINFTKFFYVQPDTQWIINPGGNGAIPNALVLGAQIGVIF